MFTAQLRVVTGLLLQQLYREGKSQEQSREGLSRRQPSVTVPRPGSRQKWTGVRPSVGNTKDGGRDLELNPSFPLSLGSEELQSEKRQMM